MILHYGLEIRPVLDEPGFWARTDGTVWKRWQNATRGRPKRLWVLGQAFLPVETNISDGRPIVSLWTCQRRVCIVMLETFDGPCPTNHECRHQDDNPTNNTIDNLHWGTRQSNVHDMIRNGHRKDSIIPLTEFDVLMIRKRRNEGELLRSLANEYGVTPTAISYIVRGVTHNPEVYDSTP